LQVATGQVGLTITRLAPPEDLERVVVAFHFRVIRDKGTKRDIGGEVARIFGPCCRFILDKIAR
jgi:hypothetical protein